MLNSFLFSVIIGTTLGFLAGLGVGGGSLLMLWLTVIIGIEYPQARIINLLFFIPCALISSLFRWKQGVFQFSTLLPAILAGSLFAIVAAYLSSQINLIILKKLFGGLLILTGIREMLYRPRKAR